MRKLLLSLVCASAVATANAAIINIDLAGWEAWGGYGNVDNTTLSIPLPAGAEIVAAEYIDLVYTAEGASWRSELVLSLNDGPSGDFWDSGIAGAPGSPGAFGPVSGPFANPGLFSSGPFTVSTGELFVTVYDTFNDADRDQLITSGTLRVEWVPEPASFALLGLGALALFRRR